MTAQGGSFTVSCLHLARRDPARALVRLWHHLEDQTALEPGLDRERCEREAADANRALQGDGPFQVIHPIAALRAVDEFLAEAVDLGHVDPQWEVKLTNDEGGQTFRVRPRRRGWMSHLAERQSGHREYWMRRHQILPAEHRGIRIAVRSLTCETIEALSSPSTSLAAGGFLDGIGPDWNDSTPYRCARLSDRDRRWGSIVELLERLAAEGPPIVVLPELTVDGEVRGRLRSWLREHSAEHPFALVVAGSFHEQEVQDTGREVRRNVTYVFDRWGDEVLRQAKLRPMRAMPAWSPDGALVAAGSSDGSVRLWEAASGRLRGELAYLGSYTLASVAGGWFVLGPPGKEADRRRLCLHLAKPTSGSSRGWAVLPLAGLARRLSSRTKVRAALAGKPQPPPEL